MGSVVEFAIFCFNYVSDPPRAWLAAKDDPPWSQGGGEGCTHLSLSLSIYIYMFYCFVLLWTVHM